MRFTAAHAKPTVDTAKTPSPHSNSKPGGQGGADRNIAASAASAIAEGTTHANICPRKPNLGRRRSPSHSPASCDPRTNSNRKTSTQSAPSMTHPHPAPGTELAQGLRCMILRHARARGAGPARRGGGQQCPDRGDKGERQPKFARERPLSPPRRAGGVARAGMVRVWLDAGRLGRQLPGLPDRRFSPRKADASRLLFGGWVDSNLIPGVALSRNANV